MFISLSPLGFVDRGPYAAVLAIWPKRPGPAEAAGAAAGGPAVWCVVAGGAAAVVAGRVCCGAGRLGATVGRAGARLPPPDLP